MNNLLERVARAIADSPNARGDYVEHMQVTPHMPYEDAVCFAQAAISAICDEIDEGALSVAKTEFLHPRHIKTSFSEPFNDLEAAIKAYLAHLKSTTEIKE